MNVATLVACTGAIPFERSSILKEQITLLEVDSRKVEPGAAFFALEGANSDGHRFVESALAKGATVAVVQRELDIDDKSRLLICGDSREALAQAAAEFYDHPSQKMPVIGITGTNGKTTVAFLVRQMLRAEGINCGLLGTVYNVFSDEEQEKSQLTTMMPHQVQSFLKRMLDNRCKAAVMEVSSHGLDQKRVDAVHFQVGVFTNLTPDHLDYHPDMEHYYLAKKRLFDNLSRQGRAVIGWDDPYGARLAGEVSRPVITYGQREDSNVRIVDWQPGKDGARVELDILGQRVSADVSLMGGFNAQNIAAAAGVAAALGIRASSIENSLTALKPVPGRMELVSCGQPFRVLVDYAHTPDALEKALLAAREHTDGRLVSVFGCGGCRYRLKRGPMGRLSVTLADWSVVTSDNPRDEDPGEIIEQVVAGAEDAGAVNGEGFIVEPDRAKAIETALKTLGPDDTLLIAGKGHEDYQILPTGTIHFDDRETARRILGELGYCAG